MHLLSTFKGFDADMFAPVMELLNDYFGFIAPIGIMLFGVLFVIVFVVKFVKSIVG